MYVSIDLVEEVIERACKYKNKIIEKRPGAEEILRRNLFEEVR